MRHPRRCRAFSADELRPKRLRSDGAQGGALGLHRLVERRFGEAGPLEELAAPETRGPGGVPAGGGGAHLCGVHRHVRAQNQRVALRGNSALARGAPNLRQSLPQAGAGVLLAACAPEKHGEARARHPSATRRAEKPQKRLRLPRRQRPRLPVREERKSSQHLQPSVHRVFHAVFTTRRRAVSRRSGKAGTSQRTRPEGPTDMTAISRFFRRRPPAPTHFADLPARLRRDLGLPAIDGVDEDVARRLRNLNAW